MVPAQPVPPLDVPLDYAPAAPLRRRRRRAALLLLLVIAITLGFWRGPWLWKRAWTAYVTRQACTFTAPADSIVYEDGPSTSRPLLRLFRTRTPAPVPARTAPDPPVVSRLGGVVADPRGFTLFNRRGPEPLTFLHERSTPQGQRLLVALRITGLTYYRSDGGTLACTYDAILFRPNGPDPPTQVSLLRGGVHIPKVAETDADRPSILTPDPSAPEDPGTIRVYFGAPDAADVSSFTVPYGVNGRRKHWRFRVSGTGIHLDEQVPAAEAVAGPSSRTTSPSAAPTPASNPARRSTSTRW